MPLSLFLQIQWLREFNESDIFDLYKKAIRDGRVSRYEAIEIINATKSPYSPISSHAGNKFLEALAWYNDITVGNKDGFFTLRELETAFDQQVEKYLTVLFQQATATERLSAWKMVQKLKILEKPLSSLENLTIHIEQKNSDKFLTTMSGIGKIQLNPQGTLKEE